MPTDKQLEDFSERLNKLQEKYSHDDEDKSHIAAGKVLLGALPEAIRWLYNPKLPFSSIVVLGENLYTLRKILPVEVRELAEQVRQCAINEVEEMKLSQKSRFESGW